MSSLRSTSLALCVLAVVGVVGCGSGSDGTATSARPEAVQGPTPAQQRAAARHRAIRRRVHAAASRARHARRVAARRHHAHQVRVEFEAKAQEAVEESASDETSSECDPNYSGACLSPTASDYDCAGGSGDGPEYTGTVTVVGEDHYGLDSDSDGVGCET